MAAAKYERGDPREKALGLRWLRSWLECASCRGNLSHVIIITRVVKSTVAVLALVHGYHRRDFRAHLQTRS